MSNQRLEFTVGSDVEVFLRHAEHGWVPATGYNTPGTKEAPIPIGTTGSFFHRDNISVELQPAPGSTPQEFMENGQRALTSVTRRYTKMGMDLNFSVVVVFADEVLQVEEADEMGCAPDFCAYLGKEMEPVKAKSMGTLRTAGGHIHIGGIESFDTPKREELIKWLDVLEGLWTTQIDLNFTGDIAIQRRRFYGQAGRYRLKEYGVEWRTPGCAAWYTWAIQKKAPRLFASIWLATQLIQRGLTTEVMSSQVSLERLQQGLNSSELKSLTRLTYYWQEKLYEAATTKSLVRAAGELYGARPSLFTR